MSKHSAGPCDVKLTPLDPAFQTEGNSLARMTIDKIFHGDLDASSKGEMLSAAASVKGSAGYVGGLTPSSWVRDVTSRPSST